MMGGTFDSKPQPSVEPLDEEIDHVRGPTPGRLVLEYGDYECPFSRRAFREIQRIEQGEVLGTPTLFIDGIVHLGGYDTATLTEELTR